MFYLFTVCCCVNASLHHFHQLWSHMFRFLGEFFFVSQADAVMFYDNAEKYWYWQAPILWHLEHALKMPHAELKSGLILHTCTWAVAEHLTDRVTMFELTLSRVLCLTMRYCSDTQRPIYFNYASFVYKQKIGWPDIQNRMSGPPRLTSSESICQNTQRLPNASHGLSLKGGFYSLLSSTAASYVLPALRLLSDELT